MPGTPSAPIDKLLAKYSGGYPADKYHELIADLSALNQSLLNSYNNSGHDPTDISYGAAAARDQNRVGIGRNLPRKQVYGVVVWRDFETKKIYIDVPPFNTKAIKHPDVVFNDGNISSKQVKLEDYEDMVFYAESWGSFGGDSPNLRRLAVVEIPDNYPNHVKSNPADAKYIKLYSEDPIVYNSSDTQPKWESPLDKLIAKITAAAVAAAQAAVAAAIAALGAAGAGGFGAAGGGCASAPPATENSGSASSSGSVGNPADLKPINDSEMSGLVSQAISLVDGYVTESDIAGLTTIVDKLEKSFYKIKGQTALYEFYKIYSQRENGEKFTSEIFRTGTTAFSEAGIKKLEELKTRLRNYPEGGGQQESGSQSNTQGDISDDVFNKDVKSCISLLDGWVREKNMLELYEVLARLDKSKYKGNPAVQEMYKKYAEWDGGESFIKELGKVTARTWGQAGQDKLAEAKKIVEKYPETQPQQQAGSQGSGQQPGGSEKGGSQQKPGGTVSGSTKPVSGSAVSGSGSALVADGCGAPGTPIDLSNIPPGDIKFNPTRNLNSTALDPPGAYKGPRKFPRGTPKINPSAVRPGEIMVNGKSYAIPNVKLFNLADGVVPPPDRNQGRIQPEVTLYVSHETAGGGSITGLEQVLYDPGRKWGAAVHFMIDTEGIIYHAVDCMQQTIHASAANSRSVGCEIINYVNLKKGAAKGAMRAPFTWLQNCSPSWQKYGFCGGNYEYSLPNIYQMEANMQLIAWFMNATGKVPGIKVANSFAGITNTTFKIRDDPWPQDKRITSGRDFGTMPHIWKGNHGDGAFPHFYAWCRIARKLSPQQAWQKTLELYNAPLDGNVVTLAKIGL